MARRSQNVRIPGWMALLPYIAVIVLAICGMNVITVLAIGIGLTGLSALEIIPFLYYQFAVGICALLSVLLRRR